MLGHLESHLLNCVAKVEHFVCVGHTEGKEGEGQCYPGDEHVVAEFLGWIALADGADVELQQGAEEVEKVPDQSAGDSSGDQILIGDAECAGGIDQDAYAGEEQDEIEPDAEFLPGGDYDVDGGQGKVRLDVGFCHVGRGGVWVLSAHLSG